MKLYELNKGDKFVMVDERPVLPTHRPLQKNEILTFDHADGMYSLCFDSNGNRVHPAAYSQVELYG